MKRHDFTLILSGVTELTDRFDPMKPLSGESTDHSIHVDSNVRL
jgi:hypothetical protein